MRIIGNAGEAREVQAVASGVLPSGQPVVVNADGTVSSVVVTTDSAGSSSASVTTYSHDIQSAYDSSNNKVVIVFRGASNYPTAAVGTVSGTSVSFGTPVAIVSETNGDSSICFDSSNNKIVITFDHGGSKGVAYVGTVSGTSISFGSEAIFNNASTVYTSATFDSTNNKVVVFYRDSGNSNYGTAVVGTVSGTSISFGSEVVFNSANTTHIHSSFNSSAGKVVAVFKDSGNSGYGTSIVGTVSGTSISFGSEAVFAGTNSIYTDITYDTSANKHVIVWQSPSSTTYGNAIVGTVSGTSISFGAKVVFESAAATHLRAIYDPSANKTLVLFRDEGNSNKGTAIVGTVSGTSISFGTAFIVFDFNATYLSGVYDSSTEQVVASCSNGDSSENVHSSVISVGGTNLTAENYIGMSGGVVTGSVSAVGTPAVSSTVQSSYFGSTFDSNSNKVVVTYWDQTNSKGMAVVGTVSGTSISFGTPVEYSSQSAFTYPQGVVFDSNSNKVVIAYVDSGGSSYGTAIVGTVSGTSISFGTAVVFESASTAYPQATFDSTNNKVVIIYEDGADSDKGKAVVGTVSGTSISFGSTATFNAGGTSYPAVAYDTNAQKVVVAYRDKSASDHGKAVVGTVSGSSISFGSAVTFNAANTNYNIVVYDEAAQKVVVYYQGADTNMEAIVGTVSGTSISFGTAAEFSASNSTNMSATYAANAAKTVVFYRSAINSNYGTYNVGTISGTSISFSDPIVFEEADSRFTTATYDSGNEKVIVSYEDVGNSQYATSTVINVGYINRGQVADGGNAEINIKGAVAENQVGLTAGQSYYVQTDGTLSTTAGDPSVFAGTAVAATKLIVKG